VSFSWVIVPVTEIRSMCKNPRDEEWVNHDPESILSLFFFTGEKNAPAFLEFVVRGSHDSASFYHCKQDGRYSEAISFILHGSSSWHYSTGLRVLSAVTVS